jgi:hypothetical protein
MVGNYIRTLSGYGHFLVSAVIVIQQNDKKNDGFSVMKANMACHVNASAVLMTVVSVTPLCTIRLDHPQQLINGAQRH